MIQCGSGSFFPEILHFVQDDNPAPNVILSGSEESRRLILTLTAENESIPPVLPYCVTLNAFLYSRSSRKLTASPRIYSQPGIEGRHKMHYRFWPLSLMAVLVLVNVSSQSFAETKITIGY